MSETAPAADKRPLKPYTKYFVLFIALTIGSVWALTLFYLAAYDFAVATLGELELRNPVVVIILHSPAIAAFLIFLLYDGPRGLANFFRSLVPRKKDLLWIPVLLVLMFGYIFAIRYLCMLFGIDVPPETETPLEMVLTFLELFYMEIGMVAIAIGWFGFFLPLMHRITKNHITAGIATGMGIAVFVAPGNVFASFDLAIAWPLYASQLCVLCIGMSFLLSRMKGNVLFFLLPFWASASGSAMQLYYFAVPTQFVQLVVFAILATILYFVLKSQARGGELDPRHTFPEYLENSYTVRMGSVVPGVGDKSRQLDPRSDTELVGASRETSA
ncbi:hypothetical protein FB566_2234 [Stackebrandtia endophytica]|uniref:CAAX prenyl protease-like protein n=1 Tax=Stackebrandtia endophytica TaxID=1496996 RepID=A0A543AVU1_9ACTN|nr:hypothetical protein [Stackebrandtia endophytica]TQL76699.1 hypothetical protein FB566_2234 [Stackebrandtia endophytica]